MRQWRIEVHCHFISPAPPHKHQALVDQKRMRLTKDKKKGCAYDPGALNKQGALKNQTLRYMHMHARTHARTHTRTHTTHTCPHTRTHMHVLQASRFIQVRKFISSCKVCYTVHLTVTSSGTDKQVYCGIYQVI